MKKIISIAIVVMMVGQFCLAQQPHFIFLQNETKQPFYAMVNGKNYSSSAIGHLILPKLQNGDYKIRIGFATGGKAEQQYLIKVNDNDQGFEIKNFGDKGNGLASLQGNNIQYDGEILRQLETAALAAKEAEQKRILQLQKDSIDKVNAAALEQQNATVSKENDARNAKLLQQQQDSIDNANALALQAKKMEEDKINKAKIEAQKIAEKNNLVNQKPAEKLPVIDSLPATIVANPAKKDTTEDQTKANSASIVYYPVFAGQTITDSGSVFVYKIPSNQGWETVSAFIKEDKPVVQETPKQIMGDTAVAVKSTIEKPLKPTIEAPAKAKMDSVLKPIPDPIEKKESTKFLDMGFKQDSTDKKVEMVKPIFKETTPVVVVPETKIVPTPVEKTPDNTPPKTEEKKPEKPLTTPTNILIKNSNCKAEAGESDFFALRKKMVAEEDVDFMILTAKKLMKTKCFSTVQIRNLAGLFLSEADKYSFLEMAYPFASDANNYPSLSDILKENYYGERFKVMVKK